MKSYEDLFRGKRVTLLGLGLLGRGVGDAEFLAQCGAQLLVTDRKNETELAPSVEKLKQYSNITFHLGGHRGEDFTDTDMVIKAAGIPLDSPEIAAARAAGVPVFMSTALFAEYARNIGAVLVGITGTRGKSTVTHMIYHTLAQSGRRVHLGGNIRGTSTLALTPEVKPRDMCVLELDSWQLQGFGDLNLSPHIAVFTNLMPDHQNYYPDMDAYFNDKACIFRHQAPGDALFVGRSVYDRVEAARPPVAPVVPAAIPDDWNLRVIGEHNRENAALAAAALAMLDLSPDEIRSGLASFEGVDGRLQLIRELNGVKIYNDNNATTPEATIVALRAVDTPCTLIVGGSEKGLPLEELVSEIKKNVSHVLLLTHPRYQGSERMAGVLRAHSVTFEEVGDLHRAVKRAVEITPQGTILFSPAFASFGMFNNEYERNDQFVHLVKAL